MKTVRRIAASIFAVTLSALAPAQTIQVSKDNRTIAITTTDQAEAVADRAVVSIGFTTYGTDQDQTYANASKISNAIMKSLKGAGIQPEAIESTEQNLSAIDDNDKVRYSKGIRFVASQSWSVTVPAKDAAETLHLGIIAGANNSGSMDWQLTDDQALESVAATKALVHAQQIAEGMAKGLKVNLGPLVYASNEAPSRAVMMKADRFSAGGLEQKDSDVKPLSISPAKITKSATVYAVFSLQ